MNWVKSPPTSFSPEQCPSQHLPSFLYHFPPNKTKVHLPTLRCISIPKFQPNLFPTEANAFPPKNNSRFLYRNRRCRINLQIFLYVVSASFSQSSGALFDPGTAAFWPLPGRGYRHCWHGFDQSEMLAGAMSGQVTRPSWSRKAEPRKGETAFLKCQRTNSASAAIFSRGATLGPSSSHWKCAGTCSPRLGREFSAARMRSDRSPTSRRTTNASALKSAITREMAGGGTTRGGDKTTVGATDVYPFVLFPRGWGEQSEKSPY